MINSSTFTSIFRPLFFILLISLPTRGWGQSPAEWSKRDSAVYLTSDKLPTFEEAANTLANYLSTSRPAAPATSYLSELYHYTALWHLNAGDTDKALQWVDKALTIRQNIPEVTLTQIARTEYLKGVIFDQSDLYVPAARWYDRGLQTLEQAMAAGDSLGANLNRRQYFTDKVATSAIHLGDFDRAELLLNKLPEYYTAAVAQGTMDEDLAATNKLAAAINWGLLYQKKELFTQADSVYRSVTYKPSDLTGDALINLAILRGNQGYGNYLDGDYFAAERNVLRAISILDGIAKTSPEKHGKLTAQYGFLAMSQRATRQFSALKATVKKGADAGAKYAPNGKAKQLGTLYTYGALGAAEAGDFYLADSLLVEGLAALTEQPKAQPLPELSNAIIYGEEELREWLAAKRDIDVLKSQQGSFSENQQSALLACDKLDNLLHQSWERLNLNGSRALLLKEQKRHVQTAVNIALNLYQKTQNRDYLVKAYNYVANLKGNILKSRLLGPEIARSINIPTAILEEKSRLELASFSMERQLLSNRGNPTLLRDSLLRLDSRLHKLKYDLSRAYPTYGQFQYNQSPLNPAEIAKSLSRNQQLCEFHLTSEAVLVFSISRLNGLRLIVLPKPPELGKEIEKLIAGNSSSTNLYEALLAPVIEEETTRLQLIPDGELWRLPFQSLKTPAGNYLIEEYAVSYAYAAPVLLSQQLKRSVSKTRKRYLGYGIDYADLLRGDIGGDRISATQNFQDLKPLPFASSEVLRASEIMGGEVFLNESVTKSSFLDHAPSAAIIHLSMHGVLSMDPLANALLFHAAGEQEYVPFSMAEILTQRIDPDLVVLSSCHTGGGPIVLAEGMFSIGSAFTVAGSRSTITSTWGANDAITHDIMVAFYEHLNQGLPKDIALQRATIEHLKRGSPAEVHPVNWANLSLNGSTLIFEQGPKNYWWWGLLLIIPILWFKYRQRR